MSTKSTLAYVAAGIATFGVGYLIGNVVAKKISAKLIPNELKQTGQKQANQLFNPEQAASVVQASATEIKPEVPLAQFSCATIPPYTAQMDIDTFDPSTPHHPYTPVTIEKLKGLEERGWTVKEK